MVIVIAIATAQMALWNIVQRRMTFSVDHTWKFFGEDS